MINIINLYLLSHRVLRWTAGQMCFIPVKEVSISAPCSCIHFSSHSVIFGSDKFYEMDLGDLSVEGNDRLYILQVLSSHF